MTPEEFAEFLQLDSKLHQAVARAASLYNNLRRENDLSCGDRDRWHVETVTDCDEGGVTISWETSWSYGGHDSGSHDIPLEALLDETYEQFITNKINDEFAEQKKRQRAERRRDRAEKKKQFRALAEELGEDKP